MRWPPCCPCTWARTPMPVRFSNWATVGSASPSPSAAWTMARAMGCSDCASTAAMARQHRGAGETGGQGQIGQHGPPQGQGAGFIDGHDAGGFELLQRLALAQQHAQLRRAAGADHDGGGRGQPHGAGAGDDEHGHGIDHRKIQRGLRPPQPPDQKSRAAPPPSPPGQTTWSPYRPAPGWAAWPLAPAPPCG